MFFFQTWWICIGNSWILFIFATGCLDFGLCWGQRAGLGGPLCIWEKPGLGGFVTSVTSTPRIPTLRHVGIPWHRPLYTAFHKTGGESVKREIFVIETRKSEKRYPYPRLWSVRYPSKIRSAWIWIAWRTGRAKCNTFSFCISLLRLVGNVPCAPWLSFK